MLKNGYVRAAVIFFSFFILFIANFFLPFSSLYPFADVNPLGAYDSRVWDWTILLLTFVATIFIFKYRKFNLKYFLFAISLGCLSGIGKYIWVENISLFFKDLIQQVIIFYSAYLIYEHSSILKSKIHHMYLQIMKSFGWGILLSIPFAVINVIYFSMSAPINLDNFFSVFLQAFQPALAEEIPFRFFLLGILYYFLYGKVKDKFFIFFAYFMMVVPHSLLHLPGLFIEAPVSAVMMLIITSILFGLPMTVLMFKKNLATAVGFHWFIDFLRFLLGF